MAGANPIILLVGLLTACHAAVRPQPRDLRAYCAIQAYRVGNAKIYRQPTDLSTTPTDVTPTNIILASTGFVFCAQLGENLIVSDGVHKPWVGTSLSATPIVATNIEWYDAEVLLSRGSTDTAVASIAFDYQIDATTYSKTAVAAGTASAADVAATGYTRGTAPPPIRACDGSFALKQGERDEEPPDRHGRRLHERGRRVRFHNVGHLG